MASNDFLLKLLILGDSSVGKTCLLLKFVDDKFQATHMPTIGIDFRSKVIDIEQKKVKVQLWDTAGQERFKVITNTLYNGVLGIVLSFAVDNRASFENVQTWMKQIKQNVSDDVAITLIGNKCDLEDRDVQRNEAEQLASSYGVPYYEVSAKTGQNVNDLFFNLCKTILANIEKNPNLYQSEQQQQQVQLKPQATEVSKKKEKCC